MIGSKKKGNRGENIFAEFLRDNGFKAYRDGASGASTHKSDIVNGMDYSIEIKTVKRLNLKEAWKQVNRDASIAHNSPLLAIHLDGMPDKSWIICLSSEDWIELEKQARNTPPKPLKSLIGVSKLENDRQLVYSLNQLKINLNKVIKLLG